jgi:hypothetical protein
VRPLFGATLIALIAGQASALSCMRPDPVAAFERASDATGTYYVLYGALDFDTGLLPKDTGAHDGAVPAPIPAFFRGNGLSSTGFNLRFDQQVTLQPVCAGPWCGTAPAHSPALVFVQNVGGTLLLELGPCGGQLFSEPSKADLDAMVQCINGACPTR